MSGGVEREIKLSADAGYVLPELGDLSVGGVEDSGPEPQESTYWDSDQLELVRQGFGLRHRRRLDRPGDPGIWTLKTPGRMDGDRMVRGEEELRGEGSAPPTALLALIPEAVDPALLHPVAVLSATRRVLTLRTAASGAATVEVMDDTVEVSAPCGPVVDRFRELEVEIQEGADDLADRVAERLREAGAGPPESTSKYRRALRALGHRV
ncbi:MAG: CYTH domain-containing protein [Candidatus Dormibacteria bacterium]|jgi:inorganic triphosphatase YgiF